MYFETNLNMLEFCKEVLTKVSFDQMLFRKELKKAIRWLKQMELVQLKNWCLEHFGSQYREIIISEFRPALM